MAITIYKYAYHVDWDNRGVGVSRSSGGFSGGFTDLTNYYTIYQLETSGSSSVHFDNITEAYHNNLLDIQGGTDTSALDSSGMDAEYYHLDYETYALLTTAPGNNKYFGTNGLGVVGWYDYEVASGGAIYTFAYSLVEDSVDVVTLVNDEDTPGPLKYYGTDSGGVKGWHDLVVTEFGSSGDWGIYTFSMSLVDDGTGNVTFVGDSASPGNSKLYGTDGSGTKGWYDQPASTSLWEDAGDNLITPIDSTGVGILVDGVYIKDSSVYTAGADNSDLTIYAANATGDSGNDAGHLILKAGDALLGDSESDVGRIYLIPGNNYSTDVYSSYIHLGNNIHNTNAYYIQALGDTANIDIVILSKGTGSVYLQNANNFITVGSSAVYVNSNAGDIYFGNGVAGCLPTADSAQTYVVYYDETTGKLSYGYIGSPDSDFTGVTYSFLHSVTEDSAGFVNLVNDVESPGNNYYYGTDETGVKGWNQLTKGFQTESFADPLEIDCTIYKDWICTLTGDCTVNINNVSDGDAGMLELIIDGSSSGDELTVTFGTMWTKKLGLVGLQTGDGEDNIISWRAVGDGSTQEIIYTIGQIEV